MNRQTLDGGFWIGIVSIAAVNFALVALLLKPSPPRPSMHAAEQMTPSINVIDTRENRRIAAPWPREARNDLSQMFERMAGFSREHSLQAILSSGSDETAGSATDWSFPGAAAPQEYSAIAFVIKANGGKVPATGEQLRRALEKLGEFAQLPIPFSSVALDSGLSHPRVVITQIPAYLPPSTPDPLSAKTLASKRERDLLGETAPNKPNLAGRLYLAANMEVDRASSKPQVKTIEFISWNSGYLKFDFGVIEGLGESPTIKFVDGIRCLTCHKNRGPILGNRPWSNTTHDEAVLSASKSVLGPKMEHSLDGMKLLSSQAPEVDAGVRIGADLLHNRKLFRALIQDPRGRDLFVLLLSKIVEPGSLEKLDESIKALLNGTELNRFMLEAIAINKAVVPSTLLDFNPGESLGGPPMGWCGSSALVAKYDAKRSEGKHGLTGSHLPSNPKAFQKATTRLPNQNSDLVSAVMLARALGLTEGDRMFLSSTLNSAAKSATRLQTTPATIARIIFSGPSFSEMINAGRLPDRDEFKDRFVKGLREAMKVNEIAVDSLPSRESYTSSPKHDRTIKGGEIELELIPTTSCLRCHDVSVAGKTPQKGPIPLLVFDPFDKTSREAWMKQADSKKKLTGVDGMLKRIARDQDMPPADSLEYHTFRMNNSAAFEEVQRYLEAEIKKVRGD